jgi:hypothetical protein
MQKNEIKIIELGPSPIESVAYLLMLESMICEIASIYGVPRQYLEPSNIASTGLAPQAGASEGTTEGASR